MHNNNPGCKIAIVWLFFFFLSVAFSYSPAQAQITFTLGLSETKVARVLHRKGFSDIEFYDPGMTTIRARACRDGKRYRMKVTIRMSINGLTEIGQCDGGLNAKQIKNTLNNDGYRRIFVEDAGDGYVAVVCKRGKQFRLNVGRNGKIENRIRTGDCREEMDAVSIVAMLRAQGFNRIKMVDEQLPKYIVDVCKGQKQLRLSMNRFGKIRNSQQVGKCDPPIDSTRIFAIVQDLGYNRVEIVDDSLPIYVANGCQDGNRVKITLNRWGEVVSQNHIGDCRQAITQDQITQKLKDNGFKRVHASTDNLGRFDINACLDGKRKKILLSRYGELIEEQDEGPCQTRSLVQIRDAIANRGGRKIRFYAETCRKGRKLRILLNDFGERIGRERLGAC